MKELQDGDLLRSTTIQAKAESALGLSAFAVKLVQQELEQWDVDIVYKTKFYA